MKGHPCSFISGGLISCQAAFSPPLIDGSVGRCKNMLMKVDAGKSRLDELITAQNLTYEQVARRAGYSTVFVWQMAKGKRNIALKHLDRLADAIGCSPEDILPAPSPTSNDILDIWAAIPADRRDLAKQVLESFIGKNPQKGVDAAEDTDIKSAFKKTQK